MSDIINILPDSVANQIAAGEVIDRPASAVKELLENAVDAGASHIQLIVKDAGRTLIQVIDDGCGMSENDARLCFERHATSKIKRANDLFCLHTMGFRGEALASIAAVSQVVLLTRLHGAELGTKMELGENGDVQSQLPCTCEEGTNIMVKNLFCNIPARRNFLKKESIELAHIEEVFRRVALVYSNIDFTFHHNDKLLYALKTGNMAQRIVALFGESYRQRLVPVDESSDVVEVHGFICKPEYVRRMRGEQYLFVNDRFIKHATLSAAVEKAYADLIPDHSFPSYFLKMKVDPNRLDVNIHPTKTEVRFIDEHAIFAIIRAATKRALGQFALGGEIAFDRDPEFNIPLPPKGATLKSPSLHLNPTYNPFNKALVGSVPEPGLNTVGMPTQQQQETDDDADSLRTVSPSRPSPSAGISPDRSKWEDFFRAKPASEPSASAPALSDEAARGSSFWNTPNSLQNSTTSQVMDDNTAKQYQLFDATKENADLLSGSSSDIILFNGRYIISTLSSGLLVVDVQRAQERVVFERIMSRSHGSRGGGAQQLLFPVTCTFSVADAEILKELVPELQKMGFELNPIGITGFVVSATPSDVDYNELQDLLFLMVTEFKNTPQPALPDNNTKLCLALARQISSRQNVAAMKSVEMQSLLASLFSCQLPNISPSGKKTLIIIKPEELAEKMK